MFACTTVHCSAFSGLFLPKYSSACTFVQLLSGLFLSGLSLPKLLFSLFQCCSSLEFDCLFLFRLFLFLHKYFVLLVPLFSLFQHCSCLECVCCTTVQILSELSMPGIRRLVLMFSIFQGCFLPKYSSACTYVQLLSGLFLSNFRCLTYCSVSFRAVPPWNSTVCPNVQLLFRLFLPGLCLLVLLFAVQPLSGLSLHKYFVLLVLLFSLFQHCSCLECVCCTTVRILSELSMPGISRLVLMFSLFQGCSYLEFVCLSDCANVQPLSELFLSGIRLLELLFSPV